MGRCRGAFTAQYARVRCSPRQCLAILLSSLMLTWTGRPGALAAHTTCHLSGLVTGHVPLAVVGRMIEPIGTKHLILGSLSVLVIFLTILLVASVFFAAIADRRRSRAEAANLELVDELKERKRTAEGIDKRNEELRLQLAERTEQLDAANKELDAFLYSIAHDLRAPLRHISSFSKILKDTYSATLDTTAQDYLRFICEGAKNMGQLMDDLLKMGRIGRQELVRTPTDLNVLVGGAVQILQPEYEGRQIDWRIGELPSVECDAGLIRQVFADLLSNAVKYTRPRANAVIEVGRVTTDGTPTIYIRDNGTGFDQRYVHKLFGVFQRLHTAEEFEGTGVGLATAQRIVLRHGGSIWAEAELDKGATFFFTLTASRQALHPEQNLLPQVIHDAR